MQLKLFHDAGTHTGARGGAFPAVGDVGLVGVVGVAQQGAGGRSSTAAARGARFTQLDSALLLAAVLRRGRLTPLGMSHPRGNVLTHCRDTRDEESDSQFFILDLSRAAFGGRTTETQL